MLIRQGGGMTEFIPSPSEKRDGLIRNHVLELLVNLHGRLVRLEEACGLPEDEAEVFRQVIGRIEREEVENQAINERIPG